MKSSAWRPVSICVGCLLVFVLLLAGFLGPNRLLQGLVGGGVAAKARGDAGLAGRSPFDGRRAYEELRRVVGFGPRPSGSEALAGLRKHIEAELASAGL
ncbi:MAG: hypothetical protein NTZ09_21060, partial [Candidatus Hydrogenedentes bacterium]|nr:hypothetical protein [Candidatus Hydrogenedentota bacterium]